MRGYVANTDFDWYTFLASKPDLEEVNFWQPSGGRAFRTISPGEIFFFKLKRPHYAIGGFGVFARHTVLPAWLAWESFGEANGAPDFETMCRRIEQYRQEHSSTPGSYEIGCLLVVQPVFFDQSRWIPQPTDWGAQTVQGKTYDLSVGEGRRLWAACRERLAGSALASDISGASLGADAPRFGAEQIIRPRLGQGTFRVSVMDAYGRACAVTTEHSLPVLEASHIRPYADGGRHEVSNGILLRSDIHRLFDKGFVTVSPGDYRFEVSPKLKEHWENGRIYYDMRGTRIRCPSSDRDRPDWALLEWHNEHVFQA
jgi:putative restriction endonuclease